MKRELMKIGEQYTDPPYRDEYSTDPNYYQNTYEVISYVLVASHLKAIPYLAEEVRLVKRTCLGVICPPA